MIPQKLHVEDQSLFDQILSAFKSTPLSYAHNTPEERLGLSYTVAKLLMKIENVTFSAFDFGYKIKNGKVYDTVSKILKYLENHYTENIVAKEIENNFFINYNYANRIFKRHYGYSIIDYRNRLRIRTAKALLLDRQISTVAEMTGFSNQYYFSRCFKKYEGLSPAEYKRQWMRRNDEKTDLS